MKVILRGARVRASKWDLIVLSSSVRMCVCASVCCRCQRSDIHVVWQPVRDVHVVRQPGQPQALEVAVEVAQACAV